MTIPVGRAQFLVQAQLPPCSAHRLLSWGRSYLVYLAPTFDLPRPDAARLPLRGASQNGRAPNLRSPFPSLEVSKHTPSVKKSSIWGRKNSLICSMCSDPPRYYNVINGQAGCPLNLPPPQSAPAFLLPLGAVLGRLGQDGVLRRTSP